MGDLGDLILTYSPFIMVGAFVALLSYMLIKSYLEMKAAARQKKRSAELSIPDSLIGNRNYGTPGLNIVESLHDVKIEYKGVINIDGQRI